MRRRESVIVAQGKLATVKRLAGGIKAKAAAGEVPSDAIRAELADLSRQILDARRARSPYAALARQRLSDRLLTKLEGFVARHFASALGATGTARPGAPSLLERFVERFASERSFEEVEDETLQALD